MKLMFILALATSLFGGHVVAQEVSVNPALSKQVALTEQEVRDLITDKRVTWDGHFYGHCQQTFKQDGTFTFLCNNFSDTGKWYFKPHSSEARMLLCRDYQRQRGGCTSMAKNGLGEIFFGMTRKTQNKVLQVEDFDPS